MWSRKSITIIIMVLSLFPLFHYPHINVKADDSSFSEKKDPFTITSEDYLFPNNGLEKKENVTDLARTVLGFFDMELKNTTPKVETYPWQVTGSNSTEYTFKIGVRTYYNNYHHIYQTRDHELSIIYFGELFYRLDINCFDWNLGGDLEEDLFHIIHQMELKDMEMQVYNMSMDGGIEIKSENIGFNDTNMVILYERGMYPTDDGVWANGRELTVGAWFNTSWVQYDDVQKWRNNISNDIFKEYVLKHSIRANRLNLSWVNGAQEKELTWFKIDPSYDTLKLSIWPILNFRYCFIIPNDYTGFYYFQVNISTINGIILGHEEGFIQEGFDDSQDEIDSWIIHYHYDSNENWNPQKETNPRMDWLWLLTIPLLLLFFSILTSIIIVKRTKKDILDNVTRKRIYDTIKEKQGIHFRDLMKKVEIKQGVLGYHLNILEEENYIKSMQRGNKRCFFTRDDKGDLKLKLNIAQQKILHEINLNPGISLKDLAKVTSKTPTLVYYHTSILMDAGLIEKEREGKGSHFFVSSLGQGYVV